MCVQYKYHWHLPVGYRLVAHLSTLMETVPTSLR